ncbi:MULTISPECIES: restriction endonuclease [unclassified Streptomyces]|uniref:restriction endonuclease n=1 Tax=unclassified Streptomyces TaxID=2593676 RepID=UPI0015A17D2B|nr:MULTISPECIES: restriction endonuclease [unclassified Streptomyces]
MGTLEESASVTHNAKIKGLLSEVGRQIDVLVEGTFAGSPTRLVVEAKRRGRRVTIETVDGFVGKLLDLGVERGIIYSSRGFTEGALRRASKQRNPTIGLEQFDEVSVRLAYVADRVWDAVPLQSPAQAKEYAVRRIISGPVVDTYEEFLRGEGFFCRFSMI